MGSKLLGESVGHLRLSRNVTNLQLNLSNHFPYKVIVNFDVFAVTVKNWVQCKIHGKRHYHKINELGLVQEHLSQQGASEAIGFSSNVGSSMIFSFS